MNRIDSFNIQTDLAKIDFQFECKKQLWRVLHDKKTQLKLLISPLSRPPKDSLKSNFRGSELSTIKF